MKPDFKKTNSPVRGCSFFYFQTCRRRREEALTFLRRKSVESANGPLCVYATPHPFPLPRGEGDTLLRSPIFERVLTQFSVGISTGWERGIYAASPPAKQTAREFSKASPVRSLKRPKGRAPCDSGNTRVRLFSPRPPTVSPFLHA